MEIRTSAFAAAAFLALAAGLRLQAQSPTATLVGTIRDSSGAVVTGAALEVRNTDTGGFRKVLSGGEGSFAAPALAPGSYEITVSKEGFRTVRETGIVLEIGQAARMDFTLEVGSIAQSVEVTATAAPLLNTENPSKGEAMTAGEITQMPLNGRDVSDLALLLPAVLPNAPGAQGGPFAVSGSRADNTNFVLDGFDVTDTRFSNMQARANLESLQEFKMQTSNYSAEYGKRSGGVMNMVLKTGGNQAHGAIFEFVRNDLPDARGFFDKAKSELRQNQFGAALDGPVYIPRVYNGHNRTFFVFSWESFRQVSGSSRVGLVPTLAQRVGDFSGFAPIKDPFATGTCTAAVGTACFPGNRIPLSRMHPIALKAQEYYPLPNQAGSNNYYSYATAFSNWNSFTSKIDQRISDNDTLSFRYVARESGGSSPFQGSANMGLFGITSLGHSTLVGLAYTRTIRPQLINEARVGLSRGTNDVRATDNSHNYNALLGLPSPNDPRTFAFPTILISNINSLGNASNIPQKYAGDEFNANDALTWVKGAHLLKVGGDVQRSIVNDINMGNVRGTYNFTGQATGQSYADFLLGQPTQDTRQLSVFANYPRSTAIGLFAQDDWRVTSRLTLNLGLRYEIPQLWQEKYGRLANYDPGMNKLIVRSQEALTLSGVTFSDPNAVVFGDKTGLPALAYQRYNDLAPRFGVAWRPFGGNRMVVRGGYGIFFAGNSGANIMNAVIVTYPFVIAQTINRAGNDPNFLTFGNPFPTAPNLIASLPTVTLRGFELHAKSPYSQNWNLTVEREARPEPRARGRLRGSQGDAPGDVPQHQPGLLAPGYAGAPIAGFGDINYFSFQVNSSYNSGTFTLRRRISQGFFANVSYVYSKSLDETSQFAGISGGGINGLQNVRNLRGDRGRSDFDTPHNFTTAFSWTAPRRLNPFLRLWQLAGSGRCASGVPFTPMLGATGAGQPNRPRRVAKGTVPNPSVSKWFDTAAFPPVPLNSFAFGNSGRNILDAPGTVNMSFNLSRNFVVREKGNLQFRWETFNALNHPNFGLPVRNVDASNAATLTSAGNGRLMQFGFRYSF